MTRLVAMLGVIVSTVGCVRDDSPICRPFVSVTFAYGSRSLSKPVTPQEGCEAGCGCNGTGEERSGDGLAVVACRCPDTCDCKQSSEPVSQPPPTTTYRSSGLRLFRRR